jgi:hypothetical protein
MKDIQDLYSDVSACLLAICNALDASGAVSKEALTEAFQERLLVLPPHPDKPEELRHPYTLLRHFSTALTRSPQR